MKWVDYRGGKQTCQCFEVLKNDKNLFNKLDNECGVGIMFVPDRVIKAFVA